MNPSAAEFIAKMTQIDSAKRIRAMPALNDKWLLYMTKAKRETKCVSNPRVIESFKHYKVKFYHLTSYRII